MKVSILKQSRGLLSTPIKLVTGGVGEGTL